MAYWLWALDLRPSRNLSFEGWGRVENSSTSSQNIILSGTLSWVIGQTPLPVLR